MEHKLDELQHQGSRLAPSNLANHDQVTQLEHEVLQLTAENEVRRCHVCTVITISPPSVSCSSSGHESVEVL